MPFVALPAGKGTPLNSGDADEIINPSDQQSTYMITFNLMTLSFRQTLRADHRVGFDVPEGGATITNQGPGELILRTPGL